MWKLGEAPSDIAVLGSQIFSKQLCGLDKQNSHSKCLERLPQLEINTILFYKLV